MAFHFSCHQQVPTTNGSFKHIFRKGKFRIRTYSKKITSCMFLKNLIITNLLTSRSTSACVMGLSAMRSADSGPTTCTPDTPPCFTLGTSGTITLLSCRMLSLPSQKSQSEDWCKQIKEKSKHIILYISNGTYSTHFPASLL